MTNCKGHAENTAKALPIIYLAQTVTDSQRKIKIFANVFEA